MAGKPKGYKKPHERIIIEPIQGLAHYYKRGKWIES